MSRTYGILVRFGAESESIETSNSASPNKARTPSDMVKYSRVRAKALPAHTALELTDMGYLVVL